MRSSSSGIPLIAAINGPARGRRSRARLLLRPPVRGSGTELTTSFARLGLPAEHGMSWLLPKLVGLPVAIDLLLSGRVVLAEEEARDLGLVDEVHPSAELLPAALAYAENLAVTCAPGRSPRSKLRSTQTSVVTWDQASPSPRHPWRRANGSNGLGIVARRSKLRGPSREGLGPSVMRPQNWWSGLGCPLARGDGLTGNASGL